MVKLLSTFCLLVVFLLLSNNSITAQFENKVNPENLGFSSERLERYEDFLEKEIEAGRLPGAVSMIIRRGQMVHQGAFGYSDWDNKKPMELDQIFYIQSMTKPIISVAFMMLYEEGYFFLEDPVSKFLPQFKDLKVIKKGSKEETVPLERQITMKHLLTHTAGFGGDHLDRATLMKMYFQPYENIESRVNAMIQLPLGRQPGDGYYYGSSTDVLAVLIEHFSGMTVAEFLQKRIFDPIGMEDTGYNLNKEQQSRMVKLHTADAEGKVSTSKRQTSMEGNKIFGGVAGLFSTTSDYIKFCQMILNGGTYNGHQLLSRKTIEMMGADHLKDLYPYPGSGFGLGFNVITDLGDFGLLGTVGQLSWGGVYSTYFYIDPKEEMAAVFMTQITPRSERYYQLCRQMIYQALVK